MSFGTFLHGPVLKTAAIIAAALLLAACSRVTIEHGDSRVVVATGTGSALLSSEAVIDRTHAAAMHACGKDQVAMQEKVKVNMSVRPLVFYDIEGMLKAANEATKQGKALLSLFGTHSYSVTLDCARD